MEPAFRVALYRADLSIAELFIHSGVAIEDRVLDFFLVERLRLAVLNLLKFDYGGEFVARPEYTAVG
jgi:hypothetical protein